MDEGQDDEARENEEGTAKTGRQRRGRTAGGARNGHAGHDGRDRENERRTVDGNHFALDFNGHGGLRSIHDDGCMTWFVGPDACSMLEIENGPNAIARLDDDERAYAIIQTPGGPQLVNVVNESGLYRLIIASRKPEAKAFRQWLFGEVLPSIRRTGGYQMGGGHAGPNGQRGLTVSIPDPRAAGVYVVTIMPDMSIHVRRADFPSLVAEVDPIDRQIMASALTTIAAYWHKVELLRSMGSGTDEGLARGALENAIREGNRVARHFLYMFLQQAREAEAELEPAPRPPGKAH
jgi:hypothetical protein